MYNSSRVIVPLMVFVALGAAAPRLRAQVGPSLVVEPWKDRPHWADTIDEPTFIDGGDERRTGEEIDVFYWDSQGRIKLDRHDPDPKVWFGYRVLAIELNTDIRGLPQGMMDVAAVAAVKLGGSEDWEYSLIGGAGTANDMHFSNSGAIYGIANFNAAHRIDEDSSLHLGLNYDGNRSFLPDVPLPYALYRHRVDDRLAYTVGVPRSGVVWRPTDPLVLTAEYTVPTNLYANASWYFNERLSVFGEYRRTLDGFHLDERDHTRLFYDFSRVAAGVRLEAKWFDARLGVGWAFDQEFSTGFDLRDLDTVAEPDDGAMFFFTIQGTF